MMAHELQHAREIVADAAAVDDETTRALFRRIGEGGCERDAAALCETQAARAVEARVAGDLRDSSHSASERRR